MARIRDFHQARWDEPIIFDIGSKGERGVLVEKPENEVAETVGDISRHLPEEFLRKTPPALPEISQMQVLRHYLRLSQETIGTDLNIDIGLGTCTMKYSPKIHETFVNSHKIAELHPYQDESTVQGILELMYSLQEYLKEISGMDHVCLNAGGGSQAIFSNTSLIRAYHEARGEGEQRNEIITTILSHPANAGAPSTLGYKLITLYPDESGCPDLEALKACVGEHTAGLLITNPEDTGIYNERIKEYVDIVHQAGGLCIYDQANLNGLFGLTRAREAGFDACHYNLHKSFSSPHGSQGPGAGVQCVTEELAKYLPVPIAAYDEKSCKYYLDNAISQSIGKIRKYQGVTPVIVKAYAYIRTLGGEGLKQVAELAILNNNYLLKKLESVKGISLPWAKGKKRLEQARLSWEQLTEDTGVTTDDIDRRIVDYGFQSYFSSHHPMIIPEPFTPEACETYSKQDIDEYAEAFRKISEEAYTDPEIVKTAPHKAALKTQINDDMLTKQEFFACTWRAYQKKKAGCND